MTPVRAAILEFVERQAHEAEKLVVLKEAALEANNDDLTRALVDYLLERNYVAIATQKVFDAATKDITGVDLD